MSDNSRDYFFECLEFLKKYQWIYNYPNTHILINRVLKSFNKEWLPHFKNITNEELNAIPFGYINTSWPETLKLFIEKLKSYKLHVKSYNLTNVSLYNLKGVSLKKQHEIISLAAAVHEECESRNISYIIDIGAGLGYLSQLLHDKYNYRVLAVEGDVEKFQLALRNQNKFHPNTKEFVKYVNHFITEDSANELKNLFLKNFPEWRENNFICITGLHACADLSVTILKIFLQLQFVRSLIIMPCCYHRLELVNCTISTNDEKFKSFPVSKALIEPYEKFKGEEFLRRPFLRLACQQSSESWKNMSKEMHEEHSYNCTFRAVLQEVAEKENCDVKRLKRRTGKLKKDSVWNIEDYVNNLKNTHELVPNDRFNSPSSIDDCEFKSKIWKKWCEHEGDCYLVEILTAFQTAIQNMCEMIILLDRVEFLRENGIECNIYKVVDDHTSPRCHALVAFKQ